MTDYWRRLNCSFRTHCLQIRFRCRFLTLGNLDDGDGDDDDGDERDAGD